MEQYMRVNTLDFIWPINIKFPLTCKQLFLEKPVRRLHSWTCFWRVLKGIKKETNQFPHSTLKLAK